MLSFILGSNGHTGFGVLTEPNKHGVTTIAGLLLLLATPFRVT